MTATLELAKQRSEQVTGVSNVAYDLMVVLTNKLQGIAAMEAYKMDAKAADDREAEDFLRRIEERDRQEVGELRELLVRRLQLVQQG
jgi:rubrerythrin